MSSKRRREPSLTTLVGVLTGVSCCLGLLFLASPLAGGGGAARALRPPPMSEAEAEAAAKAAVRAELGRGTWTLLHRMAAAFDKSPSFARVLEAERFFGALGNLYPCPECAAHLRTLLAARPVDARDNARLSLWLCALHNDVNAHLGKPSFTCTLDAIKERWGSCGCFANATAAPPAEGA